MKLLLLTIAAFLALDGVKGEVKCFHRERLGCFERRHCFNLFGLHPWEPKDLKTEFHFNSPTHTDIDNPIEIEFMDISVKNASIFGPNDPPFDPTLETKVIIHGYLSTSKDPAWVEMAQAFVHEHDTPVNLFRVDWSHGSGGKKKVGKDGEEVHLKYKQGVANTLAVGAQVAFLLRRLVQEYHVDPKNIHVIGHSLGAQTAGFCGARLQNPVEGGKPIKIDRITGLDPAKPCFNFWRGADDRLDHSDANFVDAIHTGAGGSRFGVWDPVGHKDFYPNGGMRQPGCWNDVVSILSEGWADFHACSHHRAVMYFTETIRNGRNGCKFLARQCDSWADYKYTDFCNGEHTEVMGFYATPPEDGGIENKLFFETNACQPFCCQGKCKKLKDYRGYDYDENSRCPKIDEPKTIR